MLITSDITSCELQLLLLFILLLSFRGNLIQLVAICIIQNTFGYRF